MKLIGIHVNKGLASSLICVVLLLSSLLPLTYAIAAPPLDDPDNNELLTGEVRLSAKDDSRQIELNEGQVLVISLESNPSTGYVWEVEKADETILRQAGKLEFEPESHLLGAPGKQILRFEVIGAGRTALQLVYRRPWEKGVRPARTFSLQVQGVGPFTNVKSPTPASAAEPSILHPCPEPRRRAPFSILHSPLGLPSTYDWCDLGGCTPVKSQGSCGSCWTFGAVGVLEANILIHDGVVRDLAEQYLVSCNTDGWGCNGGWWAHDYHGGYTPKTPPGEPDAGAVYEADFPYTARDDPCNPPHTHHEKIASWHYVSSPPDTPSTEAIKQAIYDYGPVSAAVCVGSAFSRYRGGIFQTNECTNVNHAIVLVGWDDTQGVWYLRNSWGTGWGESGYMRIKYGTSNVGYAASYIVYGDGPRAVYNNYTVDDDTNGQSDGDGDGTTDCGETIELYVTLHNQGSETATGVNATISSSDPYITFTHNISSSYPNIPDGDPRTNTDDFEFEVDPSTPHGHLIHFDLNITTTNGGPWTDSFNVPVVCSSDTVTNTFLPLIMMKDYTSNDPQVVQNGGFESGNNFWVQSSGSIISQSNPHNSLWNARFGGYNNANDWLYQTINVPSCTSYDISYAQLVLYLYVETSDSMDTPHDYFHVELQNASGETLEGFLWADNTMSGSGWYKGTQDWGNFSSHAGQTRRLFFQGTTNDSNSTNFFLDDITLWTYCGGLLADAKDIGPDGWTWEKVEAPPGYTSDPYNGKFWESTKYE